jgi:hypothetical protein
MSCSIYRDSEELEKPRESGFVDEQAIDGKDLGNSINEITNVFTPNESAGTTKEAVKLGHTNSIEGCMVEHLLLSEKGEIRY